MHSEGTVQTLAVEGKVGVQGSPAAHCSCSPKIMPGEAPPLSPLFFPHLKENWLPQNCVGSQRLISWMKVKIAAYVLDIGLTLWFHYLNTLTVPGNAKSGHRNHQRHLKCMKLSASRIRSGRIFIVLPLRLGCFAGFSRIWVYFHGKCTFLR